MVTELCKGGRMFHGLATDMYTGRKIVYPLPENEERRYQFDFLFTRKGEWYYVNSINSIESNKWKGQAKVIEDSREVWVIVESASSKVMKMGGQVELDPAPACS